MESKMKDKLAVVGAIVLFIYPFFAFAEVIVGFFLRYSFVEVGILFFYQ